MEVNKENKKKRLVEIQVQEITRNVLNICRKEAKENKTALKLSDYVGRTVQYTGMPRSFVNNILNDQKADETQSLPFDVFERMLVLKSLYKCYSDKMYSFPKFSNIYEMVKQSMVDIKNLAQFRFQMTKMGFDYRKTTAGHILAEDMKLTYERFNYLKKIRKCKANKTCIYYIDERVIDKTLSFPKPDFGKIDSEEDSLHLHNGYIFYHVLSDNVIENYFFTNKKCKDVYMKWVFDVLSNILKPGSLIVIDDHPLHGELNNETITRYHSKVDMINWLSKNNIPFGVNMCKAELYELISRSAKHSMDYDFDKLLKAHGFDVLRLPFGCKSLSPATLFWKDMEHKISKEIKVFSPIELEKSLTPAIRGLHWEIWKKLNNRITFWEEQFLDIDAKTETILEQICQFDVRHVENEKIPEFFYELENI